MKRFLLFLALLLAGGCAAQVRPPEPAAPVPAAAAVPVLPTGMPARVHGRWLLAGGSGVPLTGLDKASLLLSPGTFALDAVCDGFSTGGFAVLGGVVLVPAGRGTLVRTGDCDERGIGDRLVQERSRTTFVYVAWADRIEARAGGRRTLHFVRERRD